MENLEYFERLILDLNDARNEQVKALNTLNSENALKLAESRVREKLDQEVKVASEVNEELAGMLSDIGEDVLSTIREVSDAYRTAKIRASSKVEILTEMMKIADTSAKSERKRAKQTMVEQEKSEAPEEDAHKDDPPSSPKGRPRAIGERPVGIKESRNSSEEE